MAGELLKAIMVFWGGPWRLQCLGSNCHGLGEKPCGVSFVMDLVLDLSCWAQTTRAEKTTELVANIIRYVNKPEGDTTILSTRGSGLFRAPCVYMARASRPAF